MKKLLICSAVMLTSYANTMSNNTLFNVPNYDSQNKGLISSELEDILKSKNQHEFDNNLNRLRDQYAKAVDQHLIHFDKRINDYNLIATQTYSNISNETHKQLNEISNYFPELMILSYVSASKEVYRIPIRQVPDYSYFINKFSNIILNTLEQNAENIINSNNNDDLDSELENETASVAFEKNNNNNENKDNKSLPNGSGTKNPIDETNQLQQPIENKTQKNNNNILVSSSNATNDENIINSNNNNDLGSELQNETASVAVDNNDDNNANKDKNSLPNGSETKDSLDKPNNNNILGSSSNATDDLPKNSDIQPTNKASETEIKREVFTITSKSGMLNKSTDDQAQDQFSKTNNSLNNESVYIDMEPVSIKIDPKDIFNKCMEDIKNRSFRKQTVRGQWNLKSNNGQVSTSYSNQEAINALEADSDIVKTIPENIRLDIQNKGFLPINHEHWKTIAEHINHRIAIYEQDELAIVDFVEYGTEFAKNGTKRICFDSKNKKYQKLNDLNEIHVTQDEIDGCKKILQELENNGTLGSPSTKKFDQDNIKSILKSKFLHTSNITEKTQIEEQNIKDALYEVVYMLQNLTNYEPYYAINQTKFLLTFDFTKLNEFVDFYNSVRKNYLENFESQKNNYLTDSQFREILDNREETSGGGDNSCAYFAMTPRGNISNASRLTPRKDQTDLLKKDIKKEKISPSRILLGESILANPLAYFEYIDVQLLTNSESKEKFEQYVNLICDKQPAFDENTTLDEKIKKITEYKVETISIKEQDSVKVRMNKLKRALDPVLQEAFIDGILAVSNIQLQAGPGINKIFAAICLLEGVNVKLIEEQSKSILLDFHIYNDEEVDTLRILLSATGSKGGHYSRANKGDLDNNGDIKKIANEQQKQQAAERFFSK